MKKGFTLIELVIAISLSSVIFILAGSMMAFMINSNSKNLRQESFEQVKNDLVMEFSNALKWGTEINFATGEITADGKEYKLADGKIYKNGESLTGAGVVIDSFDITNYSGSPGIVSLLIEVKMHNANFPLSTDTMEMVVSQRKTNVTL
jgi:prepilin-type N-terminal cleavage/methylation domain-containing protein